MVLVLLVKFPSQVVVKHPSRQDRHPILLQETCKHQLGMLFLIQKILMLIHILQCGTHPPMLPTCMLPMVDTPQHRMLVCKCCILMLLVPMLALHQVQAGEGLPLEEMLLLDGKPLEEPLY